MKLEHCKIEQFDGEASIELGFSVPFGVSAELVTEIGRRIEHFLAPFHTQAETPETVNVNIPEVTMELLSKYERAEAYQAEIPDAEVVTTGVATVIAPAKRTRTPKAEAPEPAEPVAEIAPAIRRRKVTLDLGNGLSSTTFEPLIEEEIIPAPAPRRTRAPAPAVAPEITDMDLAKAASGAAEVLGTQIVKDIIAEMGVKTVNEIEGFEKRQYFLDLLDAEKKLTEGEKVNG